MGFLKPLRADMVFWVSMGFAQAFGGLRVGRLARLGLGITWKIQVASS